MVETIQPRNTWTRVTSSTPVKKIRRRRDQQEDKEFQKHLAGKDTPSDHEETGDSDPNTTDTTPAPEKKKKEAGSSVKTGKRIDIVI